MKKKTECQRREIIIVEAETTLEVLKNAEIISQEGKLPLVC